MIIFQELDHEESKTKEWEARSRRDYNRVKRKLDKLQREMNVVMDALDAYGMTREPYLTPGNERSHRTTRTVFIPEANNAGE